MDHFSFHSEQVHSAFENGKGQTRRNIVDIKNGEGYKAVETYTAKGDLKGRKEKKLTKEELECIQKNKFVPGLFKDCIRSIKGGKRGSRSNRGKTRKPRK
jgi:hypothetical protein